MNMYECICCLFHILRWHVFVDTMIRSSPHASSPHDFEVYITPMWPNYQPHQDPSSWPFYMLTIYFVIVLHQWWDRRPSWVLMHTTILEGIRCRSSKFVHGYGNLCHYFHKISMPLFGHAWKIVSSIFWQSPGFEAQLTKLVISNSNSHSRAISQCEQRAIASGQAVVTTISSSADREEAGHCQGRLFFQCNRIWHSLSIV